MLNQSDPLDLMFQALADPTRRKMVERLSRGSASVSELAAPFDMSLPAIVQHLKVLEDSGLVTTEKVGRVRTCTIDTAALSRAEKWINDRRVGWERRLDRLGAFLDALEPDRQEELTAKDIGQVEAGFRPRGRSSLLRSSSTE